MSLMHILLYFVGIPLALVLVLSARIMSRKGVHPATYQMSDSWAQSHPPILWAAVDEVVGGRHGHDEAPVSVGGGASGKW